MDAERAKSAEDVVARLENMERQLRWVKGAGAVVVVLVAAVIMMGQAASEKRVVEAEKFILVDPAGNRRALLWFREEDSPALEFFSAGGKLRASVGMLSVRSTYSPVPSEKEPDPAFLARLKEPWPTLALFDEQGACLIKVSAWWGWPSLSFTDKQGKSCGELGLRLDGSPGLTLGASVTPVWSW
jgi:hypothetical protein